MFYAVKGDFSKRHKVTDRNDINISSILLTSTSMVFKFAVTAKEFHPADHNRYLVGCKSKLVTLSQELQ